MLTLAMIAHEGAQTGGNWISWLVGLGAGLVVAILVSLWWAKRRLPPVLDDETDTV